MIGIDYVLVGPLRVLLLFVGVLFAHQIITRQPLSNYDLSYIIKRITLYGCGLLILVFVLVQLQLYDLFSIFAILVLFFTAQYFGFENLKFSPRKFRRKKIKFLVGFFKLVENKPRSKVVLKKIAKLYLPQRISIELTAAFFAATACFVSRYLFLKNDLYTLSGLWQRNLQYVKQFNNNEWFTSGFKLLGENAAINLYSKITGISEEMAVHSFGLLEVFGLSIVLYWIIVKTSKSKFLAPLFAVLFFGFVFNYLPININLLLEHNAIYLALWIALPIMLYTILPNLLTSNKRIYVGQLAVAYAALFFVNLFVAILIMPIFLTVALLFQTKDLRPYVLKSISAYGISIILILGLHFAACWVNNVSFISFFKENLILVDVYTYFPQIQIDIDDLTIYYGLFGIILLLLLLPLYFKAKTKWTPALIILIFFSLVMSLKWLRWEWVDIDLYYQTIASLIALPIGIGFGIVKQYIEIVIPKRQGVRNIVYAASGVFLFYLIYSFNGFLNLDGNKKDELKTDILLVYNTLSSNSLPYSYAVVNDDYGYTISKSEHHFIHFENFLDNYLQRDAVFQSIKNDDKLLRENSQNILSNSVFVFVSENTDNDKLSVLATPDDVRENILNTLEILKHRGRKIRVFYSDKYLTVYEIVNKPKASRLDELIFSL